MTALFPSINFVIVQPSSDPDVSSECEAANCSKQTDGGLATKRDALPVIYLCAKHIRALLEVR